jgi:predicted CoA-binding protein
MAHACLQTIREFLESKRIAVIGVSRDAHHFSRTLFQEFARRGYEVIPVNPQALEIEGRRAFAAPAQIQPPPEAALLMTPASESAGAVTECIGAGIRKVWLYRAAGKGAVSQEALALCEQHGIAVVPGECPFMFLPNSGAVHGIHRFIRKITGAYPRD